MRARLMLPVVLLIAFPLSGCGTVTAGIADTSCKSFRPISMSKADTIETKKQIVGHNKVFDEICDPKTT
jgi:hypothetical protein